MLKRVVRILAAVYLAYLAICLLILLPVMNILALRVVQEYTGRSLSSELILFNPFTLALELRGMELNALEDGGSPLVAFDRLRVNLSTASLWAPGLVLDELLLNGLAVNIRQLDDDRFNFSDLLPGETAPDESQQAAGLPAFTVERTTFQADHLDFVDDSRSPAYRTHIDDLAFTVEGLSTVRESGSPYQLSIVTQHGGRLDWRGELSLARQTSAGEIRLVDVDLRPVHRYLEPRLAFAVDSALLDISGRYTAAWQGAPSFQVRNGRVALRALRMLPSDPESLPDTAVNLDAITVDGIDVSSEQQRVSVASVDIDALSVSGYSEDDTHSLLPMFMPTDGRTVSTGTQAGASEADSTPAPAADGDAPDEAAEEWRVSLQRLATDNTRLRWRSRYTTPERIELDPVRMDLRDLAWPAQGDSGIELSLRANDQSEVAVSGSLDVGSGRGTLDYRLRDQPLAWFNPLLDDILRATIDGGELNLEGSVTLADFAPASVALDTGVDEFALRIFGRDASVSSWESLSVPEVRVAVQERSVAIGEVVLDGYRGSLHILPDGRLNVQMALPDSDDNTADVEADTDAAAAGTSAPASGEGDSPDWAIRTAGLRLADARIDFEDESLPIPFRTLIGQLEGRIGALDSTRPEERTQVSLEGSVDGYAPVTVDGNVAPFAESTALAIDVRFRGVDIANLTPYSGTYAGYAIDSGTLNLDLSYTLAEDRLQGDNRAVISQMVLGEPVESEQALDLPLKLALALLTDTRGIIDLEVPIEGNIDNPEFSLGKIIGRTLRNVLTKTVTSPFRFLASLVGSDRDLREMRFATGADTFGDDTRSKLDSLAGALAQRPALKVLVRGSIDPPADVSALKAQALEQDLLADGLTTDALAAQGEAWEAALSARYAALANGRDTSEDDPEDSRDGADAASAEAVSVETMREALLARIEIPRDTLDALVRTRAAAIKRYLVNEGAIAADRVTVAGRAEEAQLAGAVLDVST